MMRAILFLSLVGAALYGFLVVTGDALQKQTPNKAGTFKLSPITQRAND